MADFKKYNDIVNISESGEVNAANFLESLLYKNNAYRLLELVELLERELNSQVSVYPSFIGVTAAEEGYSVEDEQDFYMESILMKFDEYDNCEIFEYIKVDVELIQNCSKVIYDQSYDTVKIFLCTERFLRENADFQGCEFFVTE